MSEHMSPAEAYRITHKLLADYSHEIGSGWKVVLSKRLSSTAGRCKYTARTIELSVKLLAARTWEGSNQTIIHEVAHARAGLGAGHGPAWKTIFINMGGDGNAHWQPETLVRPELVARKVRKAMPKNFTAKCPSCSMTHKQASKPRRDRRYSCRTCRIELDWFHNGIQIDPKSGKAINLINNVINGANLLQWASEKNA